MRINICKNKVLNTKWYRPWVLRFDNNLANRRRAFDNYFRIIWLKVDLTVEW